MSLDPTTPVIVGVGQRLQRPDDPVDAVEPYKLMTQAVATAMEDSSAVGLEQAVDWIGVVQGAWRYSDPARLIADELHFRRAVTALTTEGGQASQAALNVLCQRIRAGQLDCAVLAGGETIWSRRRLRRQGARMTVTEQSDGSPDEILGDTLDMSSPFEIERGADQPIVLYPIFESAIRASRGESLDEHRDRISQLWDRFNQVAAANPNAWRRDRLTAEQIRQTSANNRMVGFPYTKAMNSNWDLDQASAIIVCSAAKAEAMRVPRDQWVFPWAGGHANDTACVSNRRDLHSSPAITAIGKAIFSYCGIAAADVDHVDLYSCFPSAVQISAAALGLSLQRQLTVTGGLTFAGGPLNNYVGHSIATMVAVLRKQGGIGLVTANGGYATKHALGLYRADPPSQRFQNFDQQYIVDATPGVVADNQFVGTATIEAYTVMHDIDGPTHGVLALRTDSDARTWARVEEISTITKLLVDEGVGRRAIVDDHGLARLATDQSPATT